jgi:hypothetical protein
MDAEEVQERKDRVTRLHVWQEGRKENIPETSVHDVISSTDPSLFVLFSESEIEELRNIIVPPQIVLTTIQGMARQEHFQIRRKLYHPERDCG